jgi:hypothetical protein
VPFGDLKHGDVQAPHHARKIAASIGGINQVGCNEDRFRLYAVCQGILDQAHAFEQKLPEATAPLRCTERTSTTDGGIGDGVRSGPLAAMRRASR